MANKPDTQVLIIGGGIGGLVLAAICRKVNIPCKVLERTRNLEPVGAGISLAPNALKVLDQLGLYEEIKRSGQPLKKILIHRNTTKWRELDFSDTERRFGYPVYSIERHHFHHMLYKAAGGEATVELDSKVEDIIDKSEEEYVKVKLADGREFSAEVVVGADGIRSITRRVLARNAGLEATNTIRFTGRVHMSGYTAPMPNLGPEELGVANWLFYDDSILTTWPCIDNRQWFIGVKMADPNSVQEKNRSVWSGTAREMINDVYGEKFHPFGENGMVKDVVNRSERIIASNVYQEISFASMSSGRVALLGDAAHSMTSFFGQGGCQAIEDATELANLLQRHFSVPAAERLSGVDDVLIEYSARRQSRAKDIATFSGNYAKLHTANLPYGMGPLVRKLVYAYMPVWMWMWYLEWLYGYQPVVDAL
ncbi:hypothetical protein H2201_000156 [Coniosporium apollinis]|uniref:FAD-binding domain-containing protein n=1 Tax=Coniosporium apollinis TaxID=61459 RepID=A0ABQ9P931_9PEZI|nr:hypothetical protein H2201_000156 [Coniosporium apollinis]